MLLWRVQVAELEGEIGAYSNALRQLGEEGAAALSEVGAAGGQVWCASAGLGCQCIQVQQQEAFGAVCHWQLRYGQLNTAMQGFVIFPCCLFPVAFGLQDKQFQQSVCCYRAVSTCTLLRFWPPYTGVAYTAVPYTAVSNTARLQEEFAAELADLAAQTAAAQQQQAQAESALTAVQRELAAQQAIAADIAALEERYWHDLNEYQLSLQQHISERDGLLQRIDRAGQQLLLLKSTNVLNDTFR